MNPNQGQSEKEVLSKEEIVKRFRRLGEGGLVKCIVDLLKNTIFTPKSSPFLGEGLNLKEMFMDEIMKWGIVVPPNSPCGVRMSNLGQFLEVTIIDDPHYVYPNIFLVEDKKKKSVGIMLVDDMDNTYAPEFQIGADLRIENPEAIPMSGPLGYFLITSCKKPNCCIATVVGKKEDMCRYCLKENAEMKCKECKRPYCGKECQEKDWKLQNHKTLCKLSPRNVVFV